MPRASQPAPAAPSITGTCSKRNLDVLYSAFLKAENKVGGGEGLVGIYGSMTQAGTCAIMGAMAEHASMGPGSVLVDIGAGLCRPLLHAAMEQGVQRTFAVELDAVKCQKAVPFVRHTAALLAAEGITLPEAARPTIICMGVEELASLEPATHAYAAWEGFPREAMYAVGRVFSATRSLRAITIVQRSMRNKDPAEEMEELGFGAVRCVGPPMAVYMAGSRRQLNAYMFVKVDGTGKDVVTGAKRKSGGGLQATQGLTLATAPAFELGHVLAALGRMGSTSNSAEGDSGAGGASHHGHGLRRRAAPGRYRDMVGASSEEQEEGAAQGSQEEEQEEEQPRRKRGRVAAPAADSPAARAAGGRGRQAQGKAVSPSQEDSNASGDTLELRLSTRAARPVRVGRARS